MQPRANVVKEVTLETQNEIRISGTAFKIILNTGERAGHAFHHL